ncbi:MAG: DUF4339 domain-containing protein [Gemmataceae bacterium]
MASQWYYSVGGAVRGPISSQALVSLANGGQLLPTDLVWKDGMAEWVQARKIKKLFPKSPLPPPLPQSLPTPTTLPPPQVLPSRPRPQGSTGAGVPPKVPQLIAYPITEHPLPVDQSHSEFTLEDENVEEEPFVSKRRRQGRPRSSLAKLVAICGGAILLGTIIIAATVLAWSGSVIAEFGTHIATEDVCFYQYSLGDLNRHDTRLGANLIAQQLRNPLAASKKDTGVIEDKKAFILQSKTTLEVLKTEVYSNDILVHFVRVRSGPHSGKEGWITDRYIRINR